MKSSAKTVPGNLSRQFAINVSANATTMAINILVGLWFTPYLIKHLGIATYGIVILATSLAAYMSIFNTAIDNTVGRFLTIDIRRFQYAIANRTFNTALWSGLLIVLILLPVVLIFSYMVPNIFDIPMGEEHSARWLFATVMLSYLIVIPRSVFTSSTFVQNRLDLQNLIVVSSVILRVILVVLFFRFLVLPQGWQVGIAFLSGALLSSYLAIFFWRRLTPELEVNHRLIERTRMTSMFGMSWWVFVNQIGTLLFLSIDLIIVNWFLGAETQGKYASVLQLVVLLRTLAAAVTTPITPIALSYYARQEMEQLRYLTLKAVKLMGIAMALPIGVIIGFSVPILSLWLGQEFVELQWLLIVLTAHLCINLAVRPLFSIQTAFNKVKWPGLVTVGLGIVNVFLALWWVGWGEGGIGVAIAGGVILTLKNAIFIPLYGARIQNLPWYSFLIKIWPGVAATLFVTCASFGMTKIFVVDSWLELFVTGTIVTSVYLIAIYLVGLSRDDRQFLTILFSKIKKKTI